MGTGRAAPPELAHCQSTGSRGTTAGSSGDALGKALASVRLGFGGEVAGWRGQHPRGQLLSGRPVAFSLLVPSQIYSPDHSSNNFSSSPSTPVGSPQGLAGLCLGLGGMAVSGASSLGRAGRSQLHRAGELDTLSALEFASGGFLEVFLAEAVSQPGFQSQHGRGLGDRTQQSCCVRARGRGDPARPGRGTG